MDNYTYSDKSDNVINLKDNSALTFKNGSINISNAYHDLNELMSTHLQYENLLVNNCHLKLDQT